MIKTKRSVVAGQQRASFTANDAEGSAHAYSTNDTSDIEIALERVRIAYRGSLAAYFNHLTAARTKDESDDVRDARHDARLVCQ
jgi:hypothetical protein